MSDDALLDACWFPGLDATELSTSSEHKNQESSRLEFPQHRSFRKLTRARVFGLPDTPRITHAIAFQTVLWWALRRGRTTAPGLYDTTAPQRLTTVPQESARLSIRLDSLRRPASQHQSIWDLGTHKTKHLHGSHITGPCLASVPSHCGRCKHCSQKKHPSRSMGHGRSRSLPATVDSRDSQLALGSRAAQN
ncbi:hypothetical protein N658DRAFT_249894 [Parathielavia hyrcaniae]|uniref:Uncharacterized protein n=1 Tax=Parathielavia hyrcaniae TaxID=113614 RepID=A0AAN6QB95_9PEZI|nr:hypothetical protein N658DRAFT_249894 [Parathielavia hyrcaniae]